MYIPEKTETIVSVRMSVSQRDKLKNAADQMNVALSRFIKLQALGECPENVVMFSLSDEALARVSSLAAQAGLSVDEFAKTLVVGDGK